MPLKNVIFALLFSVSISAAAQSTASANVKTFQLEAPQLDAIRTIRVYLPAGYDSAKERYPVVYMHDAQNLFDTATAFSGEWQVDEFLDAQKGQKVIIVGIDHGNEDRIAELTPFANEKYGGGEGAAYVDFIVNTLKLYIDSNYRSLPESKNTGIMGSSLGGLISFYAGLKHSDTFGRIGVFSPSFWYSEEIFQFVRTSEISPNTRIYFLGGTAEGEAMVPDLLKMKSLLLDKNFPQENLHVKIVEGAEHNEAFWSSEFPEALQWLLHEN
ncbi:alpha/beta hydrolase [Salinimicrobium oceani]|uniref:Alpha/beta hydrolase n=1 Tax=Salinimicrobium oceani TaxID=2722702 RepID=A0ABX1CY83_9FLAO|nr:alpha/beta hydrolase-fold protein [Salinimicrobium oceani]NJW53223.1 alpha/beta hydrolase [Salinimicrobium oceani]